MPLRVLSGEVSPPSPPIAMSGSSPGPRFSNRAMPLRRPPGASVDQSFRWAVDLGRCAKRCQEIDMIQLPRLQQWPSAPTVSAAFITLLALPMAMRADSRPRWPHRPAHGGRLAAAMRCRTLGALCTCEPRTALIPAAAVMRHRPSARRRRGRPARPQRVGKVPSGCPSIRALATCSWRSPRCSL